MTENNLDLDKNNDDKNKDEIKTYTQEELDKLLQVESDRRVSKALETSKLKWQEEFEARLEKEKSEAEKLAKLTEQERLKLEFDKQKQTFENERKQFMREKLELQTVKELSALGLPTDFSKFVLADTADEIKANIDSFKSQWEQAIEKAVNDKLAGNTPKTTTKTKNTTITKEQFKKMTYQEKVALFESDKELYEQLRG